ncbi:hypothetical protein ACMHYB_20045 [Sorangium sp. So ce1128]
MSHREVLDDGSVRLAKDGCCFVFRRLRPGAVLVTIAGRDTGSLGDAPLDELHAEMLRYPPIDLYVDARSATFAAESVSDAWTRFFSANRERLQRVRILVGSPFVELVVNVAKLFSRTGELIRIESDAIRREVQADGAVRISNERCSYVFRRLRPGAVLLAIAGHDGGEFGEIPLDEIR